MVLITRKHGKTFARDHVYGIIDDLFDGCMFIRPAELGYATEDSYVLAEVGWWLCYSGPICTGSSCMWLTREHEQERIVYVVVRR